MFQSQTTYRALAVSAATLVALGLGTAPSIAAPDAGPPVVTAPADDEARCAIARVAQQFVACDNLTGNGVQAPAWVPER